VVTNLIDNGQRHGRGVIDVALGPERAADGTPGVFLLVDDEGDGVPTAVRDRAFTPLLALGCPGRERPRPVHRARARGGARR
jgi:signal transduction histidine kinase